MSTHEWITAVVFIIPFGIVMWTGALAGVYFAIVAAKKYRREQTHDR